MKTILSTVLLFVFLNSYGQNKLEGSWYTFSFDMFKVVQYRFDTSTFTSNNLDWELKNQPGTQITRIIRIIERRGNLYYLLQDVADTNVVKLSIFSTVKPDNSFVQATASDEQTNFKSLADALAFIEVDALSRPGLIFYSQKEFDRLRTLPDALTITEENYKKYLQEIIEERENFERFASKHKDDFGFMFFMVYLPNQARKVLANLGYNPVIDDKHLEQVNKKFENDPALKSLVDKAFKFK